MNAQINSAITITLSAEKFATALKHAVKHASEDETRPHIKSVLVVRRDGAIDLVATDGHVLLKAELPATSQAADPLLMQREDCERIASTIQRALKSVPKRLRGDCGVGIAASAQAPSTITITIGNSSIVAPALGEQFPPYDRVIPRHATARPEVDSETGKGSATGYIGIDPRYLAQACDAVGAIGNPLKTEFRIPPGVLDPLAVVGESTDGAKVLVIIMPIRL